VGAFGTSSEQQAPKTPQNQPVRPSKRQSEPTGQPSYDQLNRIATAQSQATSGQHDWGLSFSYDIWANLQSATVTKGDDVPMLSVTANNKNQLQGFGYDAAGNMTQDGTAAYTYDAESRLLTAGGVTYTYDGDGRRVKKDQVSGSTYDKLYWYGAGAEVLAETDLTGALPDEYIFFNGKRIARRKSTDEVNYYFADHLGSSRVVTNATGQILDDADFYPFGGERVVVSSSGNNYKFTGEERDPESGTDYFNARQYAYTLGRFLQPDEFEGGPIDAFSSNDPLLPGPLPYADISNPQSLNKYPYAYNNPLSYTDPTGHCPLCVSALVGALVGAAAETGRELYLGEPLNAKNITGAAVAGAIVGGTAGVAGAAVAAGETSVVLATTEVGIAGVAAGVTERAITSGSMQEATENPSDVVTDFGTAAVGNVATSAAGSAAGSAAEKAGATTAVKEVAETVVGVVTDFAVDLGSRLTGGQIGRRQNQQDKKGKDKDGKEPSVNRGGKDDKKKDPRGR